MPILREVLDPRDANAEDAAALRDWLDLQHALVWAPQQAIEALQRTGAPRPAREAAGMPGLAPARLEAIRRRLGGLGVLAVPWGATPRSLRARQAAMLTVRIEG